MTELVSVVITTYRRNVKYVQEALESVVNQTYTPIEVILVDDNGEKSKYGESLERLCSKYNNIKYIVNKKNSGAQFSRNEGIIHSEGKYISFLDDDDIWDRMKIEKQMKMFHEGDIGMVYCDGYAFEDGDMSQLSEFREVSVFDRPISHEMELFNDYIGSTSQAIIKKECFDLVGMFDVDMPARQDYEMWLRISREYKIVGVPEKLLYYRIHPGERISTNWSKCLNSYKLILEKYKEDYKHNTYAKSKLILRMCTCCKRMNRYLKAMKYFLYAIITNPKCVADVIIRKSLKKDFNTFYQNKIRY